MFPQTFLEQSTRRIYCVTKLKATSSGHSLSKALYMRLVTSELRHHQLCHSFVKGSHLLPSQLPREHTGHEAASRHSEPIWKVHYSSTYHQCWYSFYLPTRGWRVESTPGQVESGVGIECGTSYGKVHCSTKQVVTLMGKRSFV